jgi:hypothetical protein
MTFKKRHPLVALWLNDRPWLMRMSIAEVVGSLTLGAALAWYLLILFTSR